jgi:hypothetical protein
MLKLPVSQGEWTASGLTLVKTSGVEPDPDVFEPPGSVYHTTMTNPDPGHPVIMQKVRKNLNFTYFVTSF